MLFSRASPSCGGVDHRPARLSLLPAALPLGFELLRSPLAAAAAADDDVAEVVEVWPPDKRPWNRALFLCFCLSASSSSAFPLLFLIGRLSRLAAPSYFAPPSPLAIGVALLGSCSSNRLFCRRRSSSSPRKAFVHLRRRDAALLRLSGPLDLSAGGQVCRHVLFECRSLMVFRGLAAAAGRWRGTASMAVM